jgi:Domain of unknown function (DUF5680)
MTTFALDKLHSFIVKAKANTYAGNGNASLSYRPHSYDLQFHEDDFSYLDSYFGGTDFLGQEVIYYQNEPIWAMNYYGRILEPELISRKSMALLVGIIYIFTFGCAVTEKSVKPVVAVFVLMALMNFTGALTRALFTHTPS